MDTVQHPLECSPVLCIVQLVAREGFGFEMCSFSNATAVQRPEYVKAFISVHAPPETYLFELFFKVPLKMFQETSYRSVTQPAQRPRVGHNVGTYSVRFHLKNALIARKKTHRDTPQDPGTPVGSSS